MLSKPKHIEPKDPSYYPVMKSIMRRVLFPKALLPGNTIEKFVGDVMRTRTDLYCSALIDKMLEHDKCLSKCKDLDKMSEKELCDLYFNMRAVTCLLQSLMSYFPESEAYYLATDNARKVEMERYKESYDAHEGILEIIAMRLMLTYGITGVKCPELVKENPFLEYF